jgi:hypothetical protein
MPLGRQEAVCEDAPIRLDPHRLSGSELVAQKIEVDVRVVAVPVHILAVDDPRLLRMENQLAGRKEFNSLSYAAALDEHHDE